MTHSLQNIPWARRLKLRHLEVFMALCETSNMTAAANQLHISQPAMSQWLNDLEDVVGQPLFVRNHRLALTTAGEVFRAHAPRMLGDVQRTHVELQTVQSGKQGHLQVGTSLPSVLLPRAIERVQYKRPNLSVSVVESTLRDLLEQLEKRRLDIVLGSLDSLSCSPGLLSEPLLEDAIEIVVSRDHPLLQQSSLEWSDTRDYPWILPPENSVMRTKFYDAIAAQRLEPPIPSVEAKSSVRIQMLLEYRNYLTILTASQVRVYRNLGMFENIVLTPRISFSSVGAIWTTDRTNPFIPDLLNALRAEARII